VFKSLINITLQHRDTGWAKSKLLLLQLFCLLPTNFHIFGIYDIYTVGN